MNGFQKLLHVVDGHDKYEFCMLKNTTQANFQLKISIPGILAVIRISGKKVTKLKLWLNEFQKFLCVVEGHEKTDF